MSNDMLKESIKNKNNLIPDDYDSRLRTLLASLPDEPPVSDPEKAEVITEIIKRPARFNIRPLVSAAAVFAIAAVGLWSVRSGIQNAFDGRHDEQHSYITTTVSQTTTAETTVTTVTTEAETTPVTSVSEVTENPAETAEETVTEKKNEPSPANTPENLSVPSVPAETPGNHELPPAGPADPPAPEKIDPEDPVHPEKPAEPAVAPSPEEPFYTDVVPSETEPVQPSPPAAPSHPVHPGREEENEDLKKKAEEKLKEAEEKMKESEDKFWEDQRRWGEDQYKGNEEAEAFTGENALARLPHECEGKYLR